MLPRCSHRCARLPPAHGGHRSAGNKAGVKDIEQQAVDHVHLSTLNSIFHCHCHFISIKFYYITGGFYAVTGLEALLPDLEVGLYSYKVRTQ